MSNKILQNSKFGKWTVIGIPFKDTKNRKKVSCQCECGKISDVFVNKLTSEQSTQCRTCKNAELSNVKRLSNSAKTAGISYDQLKNYSISHSFNGNTWTLTATGGTVSAYNTPITCYYTDTPLNYNNLTFQKQDNTIFAADKEISKMKGSLSNEEFYRYCKQVVSTFESHSQS